MDVRPSYKWTEVGVIPNDWIVTKIESILSEISMGPFGSDIKVSNFVSEGVPVLSGANVRSERLEDSFTNFVTPAKAKALKKAVARRGDIVVTHRGTLGQISYIPEDSAFDSYVISQSQFRARFNPNLVTPSWVVLYFLSAQGAARLLEGKGHTGVPALAQATTKFRQLSIPLPPVLEEQRAIAAALSGVDTLLAKLDQLIAKKRDLKQAAMQQLLTGQTRLPGFSGEWEVVRLPEVCWFQEGPGVRTHQFRSSGVKLLNGTNISNGELFLETTTRYVSNEEAEGAYNHFLVDAGDILLATSGVTIDKLQEKVAIASNEDLPLCMNTSTVRFKVSNSRLTARYLYLFLRSDVFKKQIGRQATGSAQLNFGPSHLVKVDIPLPSSLEEQTAIATIVSDMDAELATLEARRDKTRALKQGMMQELLTGRIRLL